MDGRGSRWARRFAAALLAAGCATSPAPLELEDGPDAELTEDGLRSVRFPRAGQAWLRPGADFSRYNRLLLEPLGFEYRRPPHPGQSLFVSRMDFALSNPGEEDLQRYFRQAVEKALARPDRVTLAEQAGPGVLRVTPALVDAVIQAPREPADDTVVFVNIVGEVTLRLDVEDTQSGQTLARFEDRRKIRTPGTFGEELVVDSSGRLGGASGSATAQAEAFRAMFAHWARLLTERLDQLRAQGPVGS